MKKVFLFTAMAMALVACNQSASTDAGEAGDVAEATAESSTYVIDAAASSITWKGSKITGDSHAGTINITDGKLNIEGNSVTAGNFTIDMTSITNTDGMDEEKTAKLVGHLGSPDFFNSAEHPTASFEVTESTDSEITGNLTIKGITKSISFPYFVQADEGMANANATFSFDRSEWDVRYGSGKFFDDLGDNLINDAIELNVKLSASN